MNKIDEIALRVAEKLEPRGRTYSPDHYIEFAYALLAELSKESKPVAYLYPPSKVNSEPLAYSAEEMKRDNISIDGYIPLFTHPLPVEAIEQRVAEACAKMLEGLAWRVKPASANEVAEEIRSGKWRE